MAGLVPAIHVPRIRKAFQALALERGKVMDGRDKPGHDDFPRESRSGYSLTSAQYDLGRPSTFSAM
jgi:hypothetical protein